MVETSLICAWPCMTAITTPATATKHKSFAQALLKLSVPRMRISFHCKSIGHSVNVCKKLHPKETRAGEERMKVPSAVPKPTVTKHYVEKTTKAIPIPVVNVEDEIKQFPIIQAADRDAEITANENNSQTVPFIQAAPAENQVHNFAPILEKILEHELIEQPVVEDNSDEDFDDDHTVVQNDIKIIRQAWADMVEQEQPFTPYISKQQKKRDKKKASSAGKPYHTRSKDCSHVVKEIWMKPVLGNPTTCLQLKLTRLKLAFREWNKALFGNIDTTVKLATEEMNGDKALWKWLGSLLQFTIDRSTTDTIFDNCPLWWSALMHSLAMAAFSHVFHTIWMARNGIRFNNALITSRRKDEDFMGCFAKNLDNVIVLHAEVMRLNAARPHIYRKGTRCADTLANHGRLVKDST
ncbi:hypothetical protein L195_g016001 [Trifolium pratense]|uniref:Uncharacterized protein n=1 Tax=Trifolium pratense TaxID=57577 RepID=A0A2K3MPW0_TRIPR|nr:hypothetical protein L195_g016001 [Trifolium pratense]